MTTKMISALLAAVGLVACSTMMSQNEQRLKASRDVPSARGKVVTTEDDNGNTRIKLTVEHLARPGAVERFAKTYVVWAKDKETGGVHNLGALAVDDDLSGSLTTVTPLKNFELFITAEESPMGSFPDGDHALWAVVGE